MRIARFLTVLACALLPVVASAQIQVDKSVVELSRDTSSSIVRVSNSGKDTLYLNIDLSEVIDPAAPEPVERLVEDPIAAGLLVHPRQLVLASGQTRSVRIVADPKIIAATDRIFRLQLEPFAGDALIDSTSEVDAGVRILIGYQLLVMVRPDRRDTRVEVNRDDRALSIENRGNTNVMLMNGSVCAPDGKPCRRIHPNRLYAGEALQLSLPEGVRAADAVVSTRQFVNSRERMVEYEP